MLLTVHLFENIFTISNMMYFLAILLLLLIIVYIILTLKSDREVVSNFSKEPENNNSSLLEIVNNLESNYEPKPIDLTGYEQDQENEAVISYEELLKKANRDNRIYYEDDFKPAYDDLSIKKIDESKSSNTQELVNLPNVLLMKYESEEEFLKYLKVLQSNLVRKF